MERGDAELERRSDGHYEIDWEAFEAGLTKQTRMFILCNPHNPVGRVFRKDELEHMAEICLRHGVVICSDEIHCDLIYKGMKHIPIASLGRRNRPEHNHPDVTHQDFQYRRSAVLLCHRAEPGAAQEVGTIYEGVGDVGQPDRADRSPGSLPGRCRSGWSRCCTTWKATGITCLSMCATSFPCCTWSNPKAPTWRGWTAGIPASMRQPV